MFYCGSKEIDGEKFDAFVFEDEVRGLQRGHLIVNEGKIKDTMWVESRADINFFDHISFVKLNHGMSGTGTRDLMFGDEVFIVGMALPQHENLPITPVTRRKL